MASATAFNPLLAERFSQLLQEIVVASVLPNDPRLQECRDMFKLGLTSTTAGKDQNQEMVRHFISSLGPLSSLFFSDGELANIGPFALILLRFLADTSLFTHPSGPPGQQGAPGIALDSSTLRVHHQVVAVLRDMLSFVQMRNLQVFRTFIKDCHLLLQDCQSVYTATDKASDMAASFSTPKQPTSEDMQVDSDLATYFGLASHIAAGTYDKINISAMGSFAPALLEAAQASGLKIYREEFVPVTIDVSTLERCVLLQVNVLALLESLLEMAAQYIADFTLPLTQLLVQYLQAFAVYPIELIRQALAVLRTVLSTLGLSSILAYDTICTLLMVISNLNDEPATFVANQCLELAITTVSPNVLEISSGEFLLAFGEILHSTCGDKVKASICKIASGYIDSNKSLVTSILDLILSSGSMKNMTLQAFILECCHTATQRTLPPQLPPDTNTSKSSQSTPQMGPSSIVPPPKRRKLNFDDTAGPQDLQAGPTLSGATQALPDRLVQSAIAALPMLTTVSADFVAKNSQGQDLVHWAVTLDTTVRAFVIWKRALPPALVSMLHNLAVMLGQYLASLEPRVLADKVPLSALFATGVVLRLYSHLLSSNESSSDPKKPTSLIEVKDDTVLALVKPFWALLSSNQQQDVAGSPAFFHIFDLTLLVSTLLSKASFEYRFKAFETGLAHPSNKLRLLALKHLSAMTLLASRPQIETLVGHLRQLSILPAIDNKPVEIGICRCLQQVACIVALRTCLSAPPAPQFASMALLGTDTNQLLTVQPAVWEEQVLVALGSVPSLQAGCAPCALDTPQFSTENCKSESSKVTELALSLHGSPSHKSGSILLATSTLPTGLPFTTFVPFFSLLKSHETVQTEFLVAMASIIRHTNASNKDLEKEIDQLLDLLTSPNKSVRLVAGKVVAAALERKKETASEPLSASSTTAGQPEPMQVVDDDLDTRVFHRLTKLADGLVDKPLDTQETVLSVFGLIGCATEGQPLLTILLALFEHFVARGIHIRALAFEQIKVISARKNEPVDALIKRFPDLYWILLQKLESYPELVDEVSHSLLNLSGNDFISSTLALTLPALVASESASLLTLIAKRLQSSEHDLLHNNRLPILAHVILKINGDARSKALTFAGKVLNKDPLELLKDNSVSLTKTLWFYLGNPTTQKLARQAIIMVNHPGLPDKEAGEKFTHILQSMLIEYIDYYTHHTLLRAEMPVEDKRCVIRAIVETVKTVKQVAIYHVKLVSVAKITMQSSIKQVREEALGLWKLLLRVTDVTTLASDLHQMVVFLLNYLEEHETEIVGLLKYLLITRFNDLRDKIKDLAFIPDKPCLKEINDQRELAAEGKATVAERVDRLRKVIAEEHGRVRAMALDRLVLLIRNDRTEFDKLLFQNPDLVHESIIQLLKTLMDCSRDADTQVRVRIGKALGEIGAIDPARLDVIGGKLSLSSNDSADDSKSLVESSDQLAYQLIKTYLVKTYRGGADNVTQDAAAFAIQEILKAKNCNEDRLSKEADAFWGLFDTDVQIQTIITALRKTGYGLHARVTKELKSISNGFAPLFQGQDYSKWLSEWTMRLLCWASENKILFACRNIVTYDLDLASFILPHAVYYLLAHGADSHRNAILSEINQVLADTQATVDLNSPVKPNAIKTKSTNRAPRLGESSQQATQKIFSLLEWLTKWVQSVKKTELKGYTPKGPSGSSIVATRSAGQAELYGKWVKIKEFLDKIPQSTLSQAAYRCKAYARSLMHLENQIRTPTAANQIMTPEQIREAVTGHLKLLQKIYVGLDDPDALSGLATLRNQPTAENLLFDAETAGNWSEALVAIDQALEQTVSSEQRFALECSRLRCLQQQGLFSHLLSMAKDLLIDQQFATGRRAGFIRSFAVHACWRLGHWTQAEELIKIGCEFDFDIATAQLVMAINRKDEGEFKGKLESIRSELMASLSAASQESYWRAYPFVARFQMLTELEQGWTLVNGSGGAAAVNQIVSDWNTKLQVTQPSFKTREPLLTNRVALLGMANLTDETTRGWKELASIARKTKRFQTSQHALIKALSGKLDDTSKMTFAVERAKVLWDSNQQTLGLAELRRIVALKQLPTPKDQADRAISGNSDDSARTTDFDRVWVRALLQETKWFSYTGQKTEKDIVDSFRAVRQTASDWPKGAIQYGKYFDGLLERVIASNQASPATILAYSRSIIQNFGRALQFVPQYAPMFVPRILTLWLKAGEEFAKINDTAPPKEWAELQKCMRQHYDRLPAYVWFSCSSQLVGAAISPNMEVWTLIRDILVKLLLEYPRQMVWHTVSWEQYQQAERKDRLRLLKDKLKATANTAATVALKRMAEAKQFGDYILLCAIHPSTTSADFAQNVVNHSTKPFSIKKYFPALHALKDLDLVVPIESQLTAVLPTGNVNNLEAVTRAERDRIYHHSAFPDPVITITRVEDNVEVMKSQQKPKKLALLGSDGQKYNFLCKARDDLRKDARMMEFSAVVNRLLKKDVDRSRRMLYIRTFSVVVLSEDSGMLGWLENTAGFKNIVSDMYDEDEPGATIKLNSATKNVYNKNKGASEMEVTRDEYMNKIKPIWSKLVFWKWFVRNFGEPSAWYRARLAYAQTTAVISIVGSMIGLGDRHGENILFDSTNGDCCHVDLNCLFFKGLTFPKPERVPFRLTRQMVDALGLTGYEGVFRKTCEFTMRVLRKNQRSLLAILDTLVQDPLVDWLNYRFEKSTKASPKDFAKDTIDGIKDRLNGLMRTPENKREFLFPLSVEGHVNALITEATNEENLCKMWFGWNPFL